MRTGIALGSNVGDRLDHLREAARRLDASPAIHPPWKRSRIYETEAVDMPAGTRPFLNAVLEIDCELPPPLALEWLTGIEREMGRPGRRPKNVPRVIDLDLLYQGDSVVRTDLLSLPHPHLTGRAFVLRPLADICPELRLPGQTQTVAELLTNLPGAAEVVPTSLTWS